MKSALDELRDIVEMRDEKKWKFYEERAKALEIWIYNWIVNIEYGQPIINPKALSIEFEDFLKEHVGSKLVEQAMEDSVDITKKNNKLEGKMICIRRRKRN